MVHTPVVCHRLFFALRPPTVLARRITQAAHWFDGGRRVVRVEHLHVTLDLLEDAPIFEPEVADRMRDVAAAVAAEPFVITFDRVGGRHRLGGIAPGAPPAAASCIAGRDRPAARSRRNCRA